MATGTELPSTPWAYPSAGQWAELLGLAEERDKGKQRLASTRLYGPKGRTTFWNDLKGVLGEWAAEQALGVPLDRRRLPDGDDGYDFVIDGETVDVKSVPYEHGHLIFNRPGDIKSDWIAVAISQPQIPRARMYGWVRAGDFLALARQCNFGYGPRLAIPLADLGAHCV